MTEYERLSLMLLAYIASGITLATSRPAGPISAKAVWEKAAEENMKVLGAIMKQVHAAVAQPQRAA